MSLSRSPTQLAAARDKVGNNREPTSLGSIRRGQEQRARTRRRRSGQKPPRHAPIRFYSVHLHAPAALAHRSLCSETFTRVAERARTCSDAGAPIPRRPRLRLSNPSRPWRKGAAWPHHRRQNSAIPSGLERAAALCTLLLPFTRSRTRTRSPSSTAPEQHHHGRQHASHPRRLRQQGPVDLHGPPHRRPVHARAPHLH